MLPWAFLPGSLHLQEVLQLLGLPQGSRMFCEDSAPLLEKPQSLTAPTCQDIPNLQSFTPSSSLRRQSQLGGTRSAHPAPLQGPSGLSRSSSLVGDVVQTLLLQGQAWGSAHPTGILLQLPQALSPALCFPNILQSKCPCWESAKCTFGLGTAEEMPCFGHCASLSQLVGVPCLHSPFRHVPDVLRTVTLCLF